MKNIHFLKLLLFICLTIGCGILFNKKIGDVPPLAKFLNPFTGFWQNAESKKHTKEKEMIVEGLISSVRLSIDNQGIPHIFADNDYDAYFSQGYITAQDRLWQMDFQSRYAAGRLSEVIGKKAVELDRYQRRMGMLYGAERMLEENKKDEKSHNALQAYSDGINAYIKNLKPKDYPIEFKILNYSPEPWTLLNSALLLKLMSATLAASSDEMKMTNILEAYGKGVVENLFPDYPFKEDPIIPVGTPWDFIPITKSRGSSPINLSNYSSKPERDNSLSWLYSNLLTEKKEENIGSNNWAIDGKKSKSTFPLLANDPHLNLTLPSIWYQIQLHTPEMNVYGVSLPGAPGVIIGFNQDAAWGVTNVGSDVLDWYQIKFKDDSHQEYLYDGKWEKTTSRIEEIRVRNGSTLLDTVYYTRHGPVCYTQNTKPRDFEPARNVPIDFALKWVAHLPSNEIKTFYQLNRAKTYEDYYEALKYYTAPAQNFVFANNQQEISITSNGFFPLKERDQGKFLLDGNKPSDNWEEEIPFEHHPTIKNPERGFVSSANQSPTDKSYPYYLNWEFAPYERAHRINNVLTNLHNATVEDFINLQNDNYSILAENLLDKLINLINSNTLATKEKESLELLKSWDRNYNASSIAASIFETWYNTLNDYIWYDKFGKPDIFMRYPSRDRTVQMHLHEPDSPWYSNNLSPRKETREDIVNLSFKKAIQILEDHYGDLKTEWQWSKVKKSEVPHLAAIKGFGSKILNIGGAKHTVNAMSEKNGPSWKMVVALGKEPVAYGILPGGQSGNPGSKYYDNQLNTWEEGKLTPLLFFNDKNQYQDKIITTIQFRPISKKDL
jgi:penicillin amidase